MIQSNSLGVLPIQKDILKQGKKICFGQTKPANQVLACSLDILEILEQSQQVARSEEEIRLLKKQLGTVKARLGWAEKPFLVVHLLEAMWHLQEQQPQRKSIFGNPKPKYITQDLVASRIYQGIRNISSLDWNYLLGELAAERHGLLKQERKGFIVTNKALQVIEALKQSFGDDALAQTLVEAKS